MITARYTRPAVNSNRMSTTIHSVLFTMKEHNPPGHGGPVDFVSPFAVHRAKPESSLIRLALA
jgi:hypothetical protein